MIRQTLFALDGGNADEGEGVRSAGGTVVHYRPFWGQPKRSLEWVVLDRHDLLAVIARMVCVPYRRDL